MKKAVFNWSGGKDSALALHKVLQEKEYEVVSLLTTVSSETQRSTLHGIPVSLLQKQANSLGIPLHVAYTTPRGDVADYEKLMEKAVNDFKAMGVGYFIFGDIFLGEIKAYREKQLNPYGIEVVEPLWGKTSEEVMDEFVASGLKTIIVVTMADILDDTFIGRHLDQSLVDDLPQGMDICGENGEYHTFCYDGAMFRYPVPYVLGEPEKKSFPVKFDDGTVKDFSYWFANLKG